MRTFLYVCALLLLMTSCHTTKTINAASYNFDSFNGKHVKSINICPNCGLKGDYLIIYFTDAPPIKIYSKSTIKIAK